MSQSVSVPDQERPPNRPAAAFAAYVAALMLLACWRALRRRPTRATVGDALACVPAPNLERPAAAVRTSKSLSRHFASFDRNGDEMIDVPQADRAAQRCPMARVPSGDDGTGASPLARPPDRTCGIGADRAARRGDSRAADGGRGAVTCASATRAGTAVVLADGRRDASASTGCRRRRCGSRARSSMLVQRCTSAHSPSSRADTPIGSMDPARSAARSPGTSSSTCRLQRQFGQWLWCWVPGVSTGHRGGSGGSGSFPLRGGGHGYGDGSCARGATSRNLR